MRPASEGIARLGTSCGRADPGDRTCGRRPGNRPRATPPLTSSSHVTAGLGAASGQLVPACIEMRQQHGAAVDRCIVAELQFCRTGARCQPLQSPADAGRKLAGIAETQRARRIPGRACYQHGAVRPSRSISDDRALRSPVAARTERPCAPIVRASDRSVRFGEWTSPRDRRARAATRGNRSSSTRCLPRRRQIVGHGGDRAIEYLGQPVIRVELLPQRRRRRCACASAWTTSNCLPT